jgi:hypothetical protein
MGWAWAALRGPDGLPGRYAYETRAADGDDPLKGYREMFFYDSAPVGL